MTDDRLTVRRTPVARRVKLVADTARDAPAQPAIRYRTKQVQIEAFNVGKLLASKEGDWTGIPDWLRDACHVEPLHPNHLKIMADGVWLGCSKGWKEDFITREPSSSPILPYVIRIRREDAFYAEFEPVSMFANAKT